MVKYEYQKSDHMPPWCIMWDWAKISKCNERGALNGSNMLLRFYITIYSDEIQNWRKEKFVEFNVNTLDELMEELQCAFAKLRVTFTYDDELQLRRRFAYCFRGVYKQMNQA